MPLFSGYTDASAANTFEMWMMFEPPGGKWVPLRAVNWYWSGDATYGVSGWYVSSQSHSPNSKRF
jgi:hypothetical protein